jgi:hypothetical protein
MSTNSNDLAFENTIKAAKRVIDRSLRALMHELEHENTLLAETPVGKFQKVLKIYRGIKPLLKVLSAVPLIPTAWRASIVMLDQALEALAGVSGELTAQFKAGRDL